MSTVNAKILYSKCIIYYTYVCLYEYSYIIPCTYIYFTCVHTQYRRYEINMASSVAAAATVRAVKGRKILATRAALTLVSE